MSPLSCRMGMGWERGTKSLKGKGGVGSGTRNLSRTSLVQSEWVRPKPQCIIARCPVPNSAAWWQRYVRLPTRVVVTWQRTGWLSNSRPVHRESDSDVLTTEPPSHTSRPTLHTVYSVSQKKLCIIVLVGTSWNFYQVFFRTRLTKRLNLHVRDFWFLVCGGQGTCSWKIVQNCKLHTHFSPHLISCTSHNFSLFAIYLCQK